MRVTRTSPTCQERLSMESTSRLHGVRGPRSIPRRIASMRVLVTGGTGFVGSHTVAALCAAGHRVKLLVRDPARIAPALLPHGLEPPEYAVGDITDRAAVEAALE